MDSSFINQDETAAVLKKNPAVIRKEADKKRTDSYRRSYKRAFCSCCKPGRNKKPAVAASIQHYS